MAGPRRRACVRESFSRAAAWLCGQITSSCYELLQQGTRRPHRFFPEILSSGWCGSRLRQGFGERVGPRADCGDASQADCRERPAGLRKSCRRACRAISEGDRREIVVLGGRIVSEPRDRIACRKKYWLR